MRGRVAVANTTLARNVRLGRRLGDRDDTGRPLRSFLSKDGPRARRRGARPRAADRDRGAAFGGPRAPADSGALDVRRRAHGAQRPRADRVRALSRSRSRNRISPRRRNSQRRSERTPPHRAKASARAKAIVWSVRSTSSPPSIRSRRRRRSGSATGKFSSRGRSRCSRPP